MQASDFHFFTYSRTVGRGWLISNCGQVWVNKQLTPRTTNKPKNVTLVNSLWYCIQYVQYTTAKDCIQALCIVRYIRTALSHGIWAIYHTLSCLIPKLYNSCILCSENVNAASVLMVNSVHLLPLPDTPNTPTNWVSLVVGLG